MSEQPQTRNDRKVRVGVVVSDKMDKTCVVAIERVVEHKLYGRRMRRTDKIKVHDEQNEARVGDRVRLMETRPISKDKHWRLVEVLVRAE